jgi:hypothetical protein
MIRTHSAEKRRAAFLEKAGDMFDSLESWYETHPDASFGALEAEARVRRRTLMGATLEILVNGRDTGLQVPAPRCAHCGGVLTFEGYRRWGVQGLEGETVLERAYYVCPVCPGETLFPPG